MSEPQPPLRAAIIPVTPLQQNCTLLWCTATMHGAFVDPGGDLPRLKAAAAQAEVTIEKILLTHGHIDHCGSAGVLAEDLGVPIEGPHEADIYWIDRLVEDGAKYGITGKPFEPSRWLKDGDQAQVGELIFDVRHCPGHTPGHVVLYEPNEQAVFVGDVLFAGSIGRTDLPGGSMEQLLDSIKNKLLTLPDDVTVYSGHGPLTTIGEERLTNPFLTGVYNLRGTRF